MAGRLIMLAIAGAMGILVFLALAWVLASVWAWF